MFGGMNALLGIITRFINSGVYTCKGCQLAALGKFMHIANLGNELWAKRSSYTEHGHNNRVFRQFGSQAIHLLAKLLYGLGDGIELGYSLLYKQLSHIVLG